MSMVYISDEFRDSLGPQVLDYEEVDGAKKRYYYYKIDISTKHMALIPLRRNCINSSDYLLIYNPKSPMHGFDFEKMLIMNQKEVLIKKSVDNLVYKDVLAKESLLAMRVFNNIKKYNTIKDKANSNSMLSKSELLFLKYSTLQYFEDEIKDI